VANKRGHKVTLHEKEQRSGGQVLLAQQLPGREEFGGMITNLNHQINKSGVVVKTSSHISPKNLVELDTDFIVLATGAMRHTPDFEIIDADRTFHYHDVLNNSVNIGSRVVIADWRADWIGIGLAEKLARDGCRVTLMVNASMAGESLQIYTRNHYIGRLFKLGVEIQPYTRFIGSDLSTAYFQNTLTDDAIILEGVDSVVLVPWSLSENSLEVELTHNKIPHLLIGDCVLPRTAEDAIFEGLSLLTDWLDQH
jgi:NADPH-dependent 2,4-dienoyl-CoA reductase/sulfur reductase-like enzyme